MELHLRR